ncbi:hypothetical protein LguiA_025261 [Lonicera macranthoides]
MKTETLQQEKKMATSDVAGGSNADSQAIKLKESNRIEDITTPKEVHTVVLVESDHEAAAFDGAGSGGGVGGVSSSMSLLTSIPKPKSKGVREGGPPPFLTKTYEMVEDPETNSIISWSSSGDSFIVWNSYKLCTELFPMYFRHDNLSSFIYQLNNYGFRKISWERSQYAHQYFQAGQEHLLKNIRRRNQPPPRVSRMPSSLDLSEKSRLETQLLNLRKEHNKLKQLIIDLQQKQQNMGKNLTAFKARVESSISKHQKMVALLADTFTPSFLQELEEKRELNKDREETSKRQKLGAAENTEMLVEPIQVQEDHNKVINEVFDTNIRVLNSERYAMWEKQMEDDLNCKTEEAKEELANEQSKKIVMELEDLIGRPADWGYMKELMEEAGCPQGF